MHKSMILIVALALIFTGCLGGSSTNYVYDGSPTALEVVIKRDTSKSAALSTMSTGPEKFATFRIWKENNDGDIIYSTTESVPLSAITADGYKVAKQVPADQGYQIVGIYSDNKGYFEVATQAKINVPAAKMTTTNVTMKPVEYTITVPERMYSGGSMNQFKITFPEEYQHLFEYGIYYMNLPWGNNGGSYLLNYSTPKYPNYAHQVTEPTDFYYQFVIRSNQHSDYSWFFFRVFIPDLNFESKLPTFTIYPDVP